MSILNPRPGVISLLGIATILILVIIIIIMITITLQILRKATIASSRAARVSRARRRGIGVYACGGWRASVLYYTKLCYSIQYYTSIV